MLKSERVILRGVRREDLPKIWEYNNDLAVELAGGGDPPIPQSLDRLIAEYDQNISAGGRDGTFFAIEADSKLIGQCGLFGLNEYKGVAGVCELGIGIGDKSYWGKGYGREAIALLLDYGFLYWNLHRVWLKTNSANERAIRCYKACGFIEEGRLRLHEWHNGKYVDTVYMGILREEWESLRTINV
jgi:RimJ/RimL family protein N-acetyltransferase